MGADPSGLISAGAEVAVDLLALANSEMARRVYFVGGSGLLLALSFWYAFRHRAWIMALKESYFEHTFVGRKPIRRQAVERRLQEFYEHRIRKLYFVGWRTLLWFMFGYLFPAAILASFVHYYWWADPAGHLLVGPSGVAAPRPTWPEAVKFVLSQLELGIDFKLPDAMPDVASLHPSHWVVSLGIWLYRALIGGFATVSAHLGLVALRVLFIKRKAEKDLLDSLSHAQLMPDSSFDINSASAASPAL
jgi:hypothetical protein